MKKAIITGACGFIGTCLSRRLMDQGIQVVGIDNLTRQGSELNYRELMGNKLFQLYRVDLSHSIKAAELFARIGSVDIVFHLAAQVAVTTSYLDRRKDFLDNAVASFNVIEAVHRFSPEAYCLYASTNKIYGKIDISEPVGFEYPLNPYTPYGVSKATGELYFTEFGRKELGMSTCCLRQSCIYGHHQYGVEDQGWLAWFAIANVLELPITIYGDGKQVRDLLFIDDLIDLYLKAFEKRLTGAYPVGGGKDNSISIGQALSLIPQMTGKAFKEIRYEAARPGDQPYFVADLSWTEKACPGWAPKTNIGSGVQQMLGWIKDNRKNIQIFLRTEV